MTKIPYYPGCTLKTTAKNLEDSAIASAKALDIDMVEIPDWVCCGVVASLTSDDLMRHIGPVRTMLRAEQMRKRGEIEDSRLLTLCSMCFNTLQRSNFRMRENAEDLESINNIMYLEDGEYEGTTEVVHLLQILDEIGFDKVAEKVAVPLNGLKVASYYGCMLTRPKDIGIDTPENPTIMERFTEAIGAQPVDWQAHSLCCGSYHTVSNKEIVVKLGYEIIKNARIHGAEVIITSCPLCAFNLDDRQKEIAEKFIDFEPMPVLYFTQLMAIALGLGEEVCGFDQNFTDPRPLLRQKGLLK